MNFQLTPTTIITGFLGSGKTTIINHLIEYLQNQGERVAYIKNEIGDEDLDAKLMKGKYIEAKEVLGGCICCTLVGPFIKAINELVDTYQPDRIIVESAGTADPAALSLMVQDHPKLIRDGTVAIIDVQNFSGYKDFHTLNLTFPMLLLKHGTKYNHKYTNTNTTNRTSTKNGNS